MIRPAILSILVSSAACHAPDPGGADALSHVVAAHVRWLGGQEAWQRVRDVTLTGTTVAFGLEGPVRLCATRAGHIRSEIDLGAMRETTLIGPAGAFKINLSGQVEPLPAAEQVRLAAQAVQLLARHWTGDADHRLELRPPEDRDGVRWSVVRVHHPGGIETDAFVEAGSGRVEWLREVGARGETRWTRLTDWREIDGLRLPFAISTQLADGTERSRVVWQRVEFDRDPPAASFARPAAPGLASFAAGADSTGWLPMDLYLDRYIYLRGTLNGRMTDIVLDSGAGATVVDAALADAIGLETGGNVEARGVGGVQQASFLEGVDVEIGGLALRGIRAVKLDMGPVGAALGRPMPVILGKEVFHAAVVDVDYPNARIAFRTSETFTYSGAGHTERLVAGGDGHRHVEVTLEGRHRGLCTVDTGSGGTIAVFQAFTDANDLLAGRTPLSESQSGGVGGRIVSKLGTLRSITFAGYELRDVPATFGADKRGGAFDDPNLLGNLGAGVFARFRLIFDYRRDALHVEPGPEWDSRPFRRDRLGLGCEWKDGGLLVSFVSPGSPADKAGIERGTRIAAIDGKVFEADGWRAALIAHTQGAAGTRVRLRTGDGREIELVTADYY